MKDETVHLTEAQIQVMLTKAAEAGAKKALQTIGLCDEDAHTDVTELRGLLDSWRDAKKTAWRSFVGLITKGLLLCLIAGVAYKAGVMPK